MIKCVCRIPPLHRGRAFDTVRKRADIGTQLQINLRNLKLFNKYQMIRGFKRWSKSYLSATGGFPRILKSPCASKKIRFPILHLPTIYQRNRRAKLAINTQTPVHGRFCHRTGVLLICFIQKILQVAFLGMLSHEFAKVS